MLYTGKGDMGTTVLYGCSGRIGKDTPHIDALGAVDELNAHVGFCRALAFSSTFDDMRTTLLSIQEDLFVIQASLAGASKVLAPERVSLLEDAIARVESEINPIYSFTIPGTTVLSGALDVARTTARRAERAVVRLHDASFEYMIPYVNRLSSVLFAFARLAAHRAGLKEKTPSY